MVRIQLCPSCTANFKVPGDLCVSCAYEDERKKRVALESQLDELLALNEGFTRQLRHAVETIKSTGNVNPTLSSALQLPSGN